MLLKRFQYYSELQTQRVSFEATIDVWQNSISTLRRHITLVQDPNVLYSVRPIYINNVLNSSLIANPILLKTSSSKDDGILLRFKCFRNQC